MSEAPMSAVAEQAVLGALMLDASAIDRIGGLKAEHFAVGDHRAIFATIAALAAHGKPTDFVSVYEAMRERGAEANLSYLNELVGNTPSSAGVERYAEVVIGKAIERGLLSAGARIGELAHAQIPVAEKLDLAQREIGLLVEQRRERGGATMLADALADGLRLLDERVNGDARVLPLGYDRIDNMLCGGPRRGNLVVVAARPSVGKTAFAVCAGMNVARTHSVLMLSMEMSRHEVVDRVLARASRVPLDWIMRPNDDRGNWERVADATIGLGKLKFGVDDEGGLTLLDVRMKARAHKRQHGLDVLIVDYLQLMAGSGKDSRNAEIEEISRGLKALAKELDIVVIALSQLNRTPEHRANKRPMLSDLRDSGAIEQDADVVLMLHAEERYSDDPAWRGIREVLIEKNRQGQVGMVPMTYIGHLTSFENFAGKLPSAASSSDAERF